MAQSPSTDSAKQADPMANIGSAGAQTDAQQRPDVSGKGDAPAAPGTENTGVTDAAYKSAQESAAKVGGDDQRLDIETK